MCLHFIQAVACTTYSPLPSCSHFGTGLRANCNTSSRSFTALLSKVSYQKDRNYGPIQVTTSINHRNPNLYSLLYML